MRLPVTCALVATLFCARSVRLHAQNIDPAEANRRLAARVAARAAAATQPTTLTNAQVDALRTRVQQLESENASLRKALAAAQAGTATPGSGAAPVATAASDPLAADIATKAKSTFTKRAADVLRNDPRNTFLKRDPKQGIKIDAAIARYITESHPSEEVGVAMYEGRVIVGMPEDALKVYGQYTVRSESANSKTAAFIINDFTLHRASDFPIYELQLEDGKVSSFRNPGL